MSNMPPPVSDQAVLKLLNVESAYGPIAIRGVSCKCAAANCHRAGLKQCG